MPTDFPPQHGRSHIPSGYEVVVQPTGSGTAVSPTATVRPSDPMPAALAVPGSGLGAAMVRATKTGFTQSGSYRIPWTDVDTDDTSVFGITTNTLTNDTFQLKKQGLYLCIAQVYATTATVDYSLQIDLGGSMFPSAMDLLATLDEYDGLAGSGAMSQAMRLMHASSVGGSTTGVTIVRAGSKSFDGAAAYIIYWPSSVPGATGTDIG